LPCTSTCASRVVPPLLAPGAMAISDAQKSAIEDIINILTGYTQGV
jgi:hypothetical protein